MGKRKGNNSLLKLAYKRVPKKIWINEGFGIGHYKYVKTEDKDNGEKLFHKLEFKGAPCFEEEVEIPPTLEKMGLTRNKYGQIVPIKPRD